MTKGDASNARPNFFIVGAPKAGTTSLDRLLRAHPEVFLSPIKEPCHFCGDMHKEMVRALAKQSPVDIKQYLAQGTRPVIHNHIVVDRTDYESLFSGSYGRPRVGECSTWYLSSKYAPRQIWEYNPSAKIVAVLRDPMSRIISHYLMDRRTGVTIESIEKLLIGEIRLGEKASCGNSRFYLGASRYAMQLQRYYEYFRNDQILVMIFEEILDNPQEQLRALYEFLGIKVGADSFALPRVNESQGVRFENLNFILFQLGLKAMFEQWLPKVLPKGVREMVKSTYFKPSEKARRTLALGPDVRREIGHLKDEAIHFLGRRPLGW